MNTRCAAACRARPPRAVGLLLALVAIAALACLLGARAIPTRPSLGSPAAAPTARSAAHHTVHNDPCDLIVGLARDYCEPTGRAGAACAPRLGTTSALAVGGLAAAGLAAAGLLAAAGGRQAGRKRV